MLLRHAVDRFEKGFIGQGYSRSSVATYMRHLRHLKARLGDMEVDDVRRADVSEFLYDVRLKEDGTEKHQRTINGASLICCCYAAILSRFSTFHGSDVHGLSIARNTATIARRKISRKVSALVARPACMAGVRNLIARRPD